MLGFGILVFWLWRVTNRIKNYLYQNSTLSLPILSFYSAEKDFTNGLFSLQDAWIWVGAFGLWRRFWTLWMLFGLGGSLFLLEIFAGSVSLSFLTRLQVGVLDLVMWPWCSRVIKYIFGSLCQTQLTVVLRTSAVVIRCLCSPLGVLGVPLPSFFNSNS